jgi:hypothetical protein
MEFLFFTTFIYTRGYVIQKINAKEEVNEKTRRIKTQSVAQNVKEESAKRRRMWM